jgi:hypothetical protein
MTQGLISIQVRDIDLSDHQKIDDFCKSIMPVVAQEIAKTINAPKSKGCSVSGTVTGGSGGVSGSGTVTCTF